MQPTELHTPQVATEIDCSGQKKREKKKKRGVRDEKQSFPREWR